jgi:hypothetical protein
MWYRTSAPEMVICGLPCAPLMLIKLLAYRLLMELSRNIAPE